jgi:hypothetical protein
VSRSITEVNVSVSVLVLSFLGAAAAATPTQPIQGCACAPRPAHAVDAMSDARAVFAGRVREVKAQDDGSAVVTFAVGRAWKGARKGPVVVSAPSGDCAMPFAAGKDYLVFAEGTKESLKVDACGTRELSASGAAVSQLDMNGGYAGRPLRMPEQ